MTAPLLIIVPTRGRRANLERLLQTFALSRAGETDLLVVADDDDPSYDGLKLPGRCRLVSRPRACLTDKLNQHAVPLTAEYQMIGFLGDDCVLESHGWDNAFRDELKTPGIAWPNGERQDYGEHEVVSSVIIRALGWYFPPEMSHYWTDVALADIGRGAGCYRKAEGAIIRHRHKEHGTDDTYRLAESTAEADQQAYWRWHETRRNADIATVKAAIGLDRCLSF